MILYRVGFIYVKPTPLGGDIVRLVDKQAMSVVHLQAVSSNGSMRLLAAGSLSDSLLSSMEYCITSRLQLPGVQVISYLEIVYPKHAELPEYHKWVWLE